MSRFNRLSEGCFRSRIWRGSTRVATKIGYDNPCTRSVRAYRHKSIMTNEPVAKQNGRMRRQQHTEMSGIQ